MQNKLQELTEKIFKEGVEKGNAEAQQILENAKSEAESIIAKAKKEAVAVVEDAKKKANEVRVNTESEIRLSGKQAINALKQQVTDLVNGAIVKGKIDGSFDNDFLKKLIEATLSNWAKSGQTMDLNILLPASDEKELAAYFNKAAKEYLDKGLDISFDSAIKTGFQLSPKDGSYKVSFTDEDFINFFKQYLRPKLVEILFSAE